MGEDHYIYAEKLSDEEREILHLGRKLRAMGKDPVKILRLVVEAGGKIEKPLSMGKTIGGFFKKQWETSKTEFKRGMDEAGEDGSETKK